jgi:rhodanese-related sulfurtransferase
MRKARTVLLEAVLVAALGLVFALAANALSPHGLRLTRNYFPKGEPDSGKLKPGQQTGSNTVVGKAASSTAPEGTIQRLQQHGLQAMDSNDVAELFGSQGFQQGLLLLIDARDDSHYEQGHIPGAWQFDHYHAEQYFPTILPLCLRAQKVVVYCTGGACEDSEFAAIMLRDAGVPRDSLYVYAGGITEWTNSGQPVETGGRQSGQLLKPKL